MRVQAIIFVKSAVMSLAVLCNHGSVREEAQFTARPWRLRCRYERGPALYVAVYSEIHGNIGPLRILASMYTQAFTRHSYCCLDHDYTAIVL